jgi:protein-L-isoaspartate(D-aspartate) O-methyltransferase
VYETKTSDSRTRGGSTARDSERQREALLAEIDAEMLATSRFTGRAALAPAVREALRQVAREEFVAACDRDVAYINRPLPIGHGQTISQPFIVALMTELLDPRPEHVMLEVGTGSGYQAAVLSRLVARLYSVETLGELAETARERLARLGYGNVAVRHGDGAEGWPEHAPYDGIVVTAATPRIPPALLTQLAPGARLVIPLGRPFGSQILSVVTRDARGRVDSDGVLGVAFVPLT